MKYLCIMIVSVMTLWGTRVQAVPFGYLDTANPVRVAYPASSGQGASAFDVIGSTVGADSFYATTMLGNPATFGVAEYTLNRVPDAQHPWGLIQPLTNATDPTENRRWIIPISNTNNNAYTKAIDIVTESANAVRILTTVESGLAASGLQDGSIEMITVTDRSLGTGSSALWKNLQSERFGGGVYYGPEGIAVDRTNGQVAVVSDTGGGPGTDSPTVQGVRTYSYNGSYAESGTVNNQQIEANGTDARQVISLADGTFLANKGIGGASTVDAWLKVDPVGNTVTTILDNLSSQQDAAIYSPDGGSTYFLYLLDSGNREVVAYEWDNANQTVVDITPDGTIALDPIVSSVFGWTNAGYPSGLSFTTNGEMLIAFAQNGSPGGVIAFNLQALPENPGVPEPSSIYLLAMSGLLISRWHRKRRA